ncbi:Tungsten-containing aldehyde ferredoxin oxidoreductase Aor [Desulfosarcina cetonica]|uniref:aldehyde ferredoxin oxidoreductase family protein n=1 Tax=Desulfosarcina cetonica TaxID=90730 RepID=UPI0006D1A8A4|nr:aldehyde ferredoxin oxidoreductase family protein [Desulfosarcina cetonica]VTR70414.1 Tungsten-containing aldehyde ferredoxin oxidoreductase Aor [Desulfosarcina cetonica]
MHGFFKRLLDIDLSKMTFGISPLPDALLEKTLGGKGLATHLLLEHNPAGVDPLGADNRLIFALGPVTDTAVWGGCRYGVYTKSPQTGFYSESYSGGTAAEYMSRAGFDAVMIQGRAKSPVWIEINPEGAVFHDARKWWGKGTYETEDCVKAWIKENRPAAKKCAALVIGPGGEHQVVFAVIENDYWRSAGRTGGGAVMGSKNIKAIGFWGNQKRNLADPDKIRALARQFGDANKDHPGAKAYKNLGTPMMVDIMSAANSFPTRYWHQGQAPHRESINAAALHERCAVHPRACRKCFMACGRLSTVKEGRHVGLKIEGPEYETIYTFGGLCMVDNIEDIVYLNDVCDRLGIDTISAGNLVALVIEAAKKGTVQYPIDYGETDKIAALLEDIAAKQGLGEILSKGIKTAAAALEMADQAIHVKGLEPAGYDPRVLKGMGLSYGTSPRGACHLRTTFYKPELSKMIEPDQIDGKAEMLVDWEDRLIIFDCLVLCRFYRDFYQWEELTEMIEAVTGATMDQQRLRKIAGQISDNTRRFNLKEGLTREDDKLPKRFYQEPLPEIGKVIPEAEMDRLLDDYYAQRHWKEKGLMGEG